MQKHEEFEWCHDCAEYDQVHHCCHRWTKVIRNTVEELKESYSKDVVDKNKLVETIKHCMQYPNGLNRLLAIYEGEQNEVD